MAPPQDTLQLGFYTKQQIGWHLSKELRVFRDDDVEVQRRHTAAAPVQHVGPSSLGVHHDLQDRIRVYHVFCDRFFALNLQRAGAERICARLDSTFVINDLRGKVVIA